MPQVQTTQSPITTILNNLGQAEVICSIWVFATDANGNKAGQVDHAYLNGGRDTSPPLNPGIYLYEWAWSASDIGKGPNYSFTLEVNGVQQDIQNGNIPSGKTASNNGYFTLTVK